MKKSLATFAVLAIALSPITAVAQAQKSVETAEKGSAAGGDKRSASPAADRQSASPKADKGSASGDDKGSLSPAADKGSASPAADKGPAAKK